MVTGETRKKSLLEPLVTTASFLGIVQGLAWFLLCLTAIFLYEEVILPISVTYTSTNVGRTMFDLYLNKNKEDQTFGVTIIIGPKEFNIFMYFYVVLSFALLLVSCVMLWAIRNGKFGNNYKLRICLWIVLVTFLSILDLIFVCLLAHDYDQLSKLYSGDANVNLVTAGIVMTLAARGFVIWIINVIFVIVLGKHWCKLHTKETRSNQRIIDAYSTDSKPPWELEDSFHRGKNSSAYNNRAFINDDDNPIVPSQSFTHLPVNDNENYLNRVRNNYRDPTLYNNNNNNWNRRNQNENGQSDFAGNNSPLRSYPLTDRSEAPHKTAKIGRQGGQKSPPLNVNPPFIPDPDYSPPGSPKVRGVLRPNSNYIMY